MAGKFNYYKLDVWQVGMKIVSRIYDLTKHFPGEELYGLTSQTRRSATSIVLNIAEGSGRRTRKDFCKFIRISCGSCLELQTCLDIALKQSYLTDEDLNATTPLIEEAYFKLIALEKSLNKLNKRSD